MYLETDSKKTGLKADLTKLFMAAQSISKQLWLQAEISDIHFL
jgi:hypothetical protein